MGAVVGALAGTGGWAASLIFPHAIVVGIAFGLSIVLTGALHVDGFLDTCDAVFASVSPERRLEILKDTRHGSFAIAYFAVAVVLWLGALWAIDPVRLPLGMAFASAAARWIAVSIARVIPYGDGARPPAAIHAVMAALTIVLGWSYWGHAAVLLALGMLTFAAAFAIRPRLGGRLTGDVYGFLIVCTDVAILAGLSITSPAPL